MNVVFRADASRQIGTGHVMRCLTLAHALHERGANCRFVCREHPGNLIELIRESGFEVLALPLQPETQQTVDKGGECLPAHASWVGTDWGSDAEATGALFGDIEVDWLIVDHYGLDARWESTLRPYCRKLMVIDDLADRQHDCDLLLDQNLVPHMAQRYDSKLPPHCEKVLGPDYALLQPQYADLRRRIPVKDGQVRRLMIYLGGSDTTNVTDMAVDALISLQLSRVKTDVVLNSASSHAKSLRKKCANSTNITIHENLPSLASLMGAADLAIGGGGASSLERLCMGLPSLVITLAENQVPTIAYQESQGLVRWVGHKDAISTEIVSGAVKKAIESESLVEWSNLCRAAVDGRGVTRVCSFF